MTATHDGIIIGAGPAGSTAAILLARAGWSVALIESKRFPRRKVCGECIAASNLPLLDALGVGEQLRQRAGPELRRVALWRGEERISARLPARAGPHPWGYALRREHLDLLLIERARSAGASVLQPARALAVRRRRAGDTLREVQVDRQEAPHLTLRAPVVICAHGSWESPPTAGSFAPRAPHRPGDLLAFKANFRGANLEKGLLPVLAFPGGYGGMVMSGDELATLACCIRRDRLTAWRRREPSAAAGEVIEALLARECRGVREALDGARRVGPWLAAGPIRPGVRLRELDPDAFRIGNAAGEVHPIIGEGISMALQSAWLLCAALTCCAPVRRGDRGGERHRMRIQERYASSWNAHFSRRLWLAACFARAAMRPALSTPLLPLLRRAPALLSLAARASGKTRCAITLSSEADPGLLHGASS
jgi:flavin-dependent dehydrogenase